MLIEFSKCNSLIESLHGARVKKIFHVGAHIGEEAGVYAQNHVESVIWFEANTDLIPILNANISVYAMNQMIAPFALFNENKVLQFNITNNFQSSSFFDLEKHAEYYPQILVTGTKELQVFRLDSLIDVQPNCLPWHDFGFINIDTQGAELAVLQGLGKYIAMDSIKGIYLEVNSEPLYKDIPLVGEIDVFLDGFGFKRIITDWTDAGWGDALYVKIVDNKS